MMSFRDRICRMNETLLDLIVGCVIYSLVFECIGLIFVQDKIAWTLGLVLGTLAATGLAVNMYHSIDYCLSLDPVRARRAMTLRSILRLLVMLGAALAAMRLSFLSFPAVIVGILGLKVSSHLHMYTHIYITKKLCKLLMKGG